VGSALVFANADVQSVVSAKVSRSEAHVRFALGNPSLRVLLRGVCRQNTVLFDGLHIFLVGVFQASGVQGVHVTLAKDRRVCTRSTDG